MSEAKVEAEIHAAALRLHTATTPRARRDAWAALLRARDKRSPARIRQMELEQGLITPAPMRKA